MPRSTIDTRECEQHKVACRNARPTRNGEPAMPTAPVRGTEIYYEIEGVGDWVVFAHGGEGRASIGGNKRCEPPRRR